MGYYEEHRAAKGDFAFVEGTWTRGDRGAWDVKVNVKQDCEGAVVPVRRKNGTGKCVKSGDSGNLSPYYGDPDELSPYKGRYGKDRVMACPACG